MIDAILSIIAECSIALAYLYAKDILELMLGVDKNLYRELKKECTWINNSIPLRYRFWYFDTTIESMILGNYNWCIEFIFLRTTIK